jgi:hypothetical protein
MCLNLKLQLEIVREMNTGTGLTLAFHQRLSREFWQEAYFYGMVELEKKLVEYGVPRGEYWRRRLPGLARETVPNPNDVAIWNDFYDNFVRWAEAKIEACPCE